MRAAFFGTYNRGHSANRIAAAAVRAAGFEIVEIHDPLWERTRDKDARYFSPRSLAGLALAWLRSASRLLRTWRRSGGAPVAIVGFNGQLDVLLLRAVAGRYGPRIVFAPLVTLTETLVDDRGVYREGSLPARLLAAIDRATCRAADVVVVDTDEHRRWFQDELGVDPSRLLVCRLGADPDVFLDPVPAHHHPAADDGRLDVLWFGQYLPLHGLDVIVDAVGRLAVRDELRGRLRFTFIGTGEERARVEPVLRATRADLRFVDWVAYEELGARIADADIVLGIFGSSQKAKMVIPNKVYEAAAVGRAIVTADTPALREVFENGSDILFCAADGRSLADAIAWLADPAAGEARRAELGANARRLMLQHFSRDALGRAWSVALRGAFAPVARRHVAPGDALATAQSGAASSSAPSSAAGEATARVGVAILAFQDARRALACLHSVAGDGWPDLDLLVVDNGSVERERRLLAEGIATSGLDAELLPLDENLGYAGANNLAMRRLFDRGCEAVLLLNSDIVVAPGSIDALQRASRADRRAAPLGPAVFEGRPGGEAQSLGERFGAATLWAPRTLLRVRRRRQRPYPVSGVLGCALFVPRALFEKVGGFDETLFAYYEEVDLCLRAREAGFVPTVAPEAQVGHEGSRGFASGMTPLAAWLKARNLGLVGRRRVRGIRWLVFELGYHGLVAASAALYALRGRGSVAASLFGGLFAAGRGESGAPPARLFAASGYASSGLGAAGGAVVAARARKDAEATEPQP